MNHLPDTKMSARWMRFGMWKNACELDLLLTHYSYMYVIYVFMSLITRTMPIRRRSLGIVQCPIASHVRCEAQMYMSTSR